MSGIIHNSTLTFISIPTYLTDKNELKGQADLINWVSSTINPSFVSAQNETAKDSGLILCHVIDLKTCHIKLNLVHFDIS